MGSKEIFALRKQNTNQALAMARNEYSNNSNDIWFIRAYAWCIFDQVKIIVQNYENNQLSGFLLSNQISLFMREFSNIGFSLKGDMCFSQILNLANKTSRDWNEFLSFAYWAGLDCFSDDDKKPYIAENGDKIDSLQSRYLRSIIREISVHQNNLTPEIIQWGESVIEMALGLNPNDQWIYYYQSRIHLNGGNFELAIKSLMPVIHRQKNAYWVWGLLASILENTQPDNSLIFYIYATQLSKSEQELAKLRITLAKKLVSCERYEEASFQIQKALKYRQDNNFRIPDDLLKLRDSNWYQNIITNNKVKKCQDVKEKALSLLYSLDKENISIQYGVLEHHNKEKKIAYVITSSDGGVAIPYSKYPHIQKLPVGIILEISFSKFNSKNPLFIKVSDKKEIQGLCQLFTGELSKVANKNFAFIKSGDESIFITPYFAESYESDITYKVQCKAIKVQNKQGKIGWRAIEISNLD